jgi:hypothetical protein
MLNRTSLNSAFAPGFEEPATSRLLTGRWRKLTFGLHLPSNLQGYLFFVLCLLILAFTMALHITLSAETMRLNQRLFTLKEEYARTERINANLVWEISQSTSLASVNAAAVGMGYVPLTEFKYVVIGSMESGSTPAANVAGEEQGWSVGPSAENPVVVIPSTLGNPVPAAPQMAPQPAMPYSAGADGPLQTPGIRLGQVNSEPAWRSSFSMDELRAAASETIRWLQDRLPRR